MLPINFDTTLQSNKILKVRDPLLHKQISFNILSCTPKPKFDTKIIVKRSDVLDLLVPILHYLTDARADQSRIGLMHIGNIIYIVFKKIHR